MLSLAAPKRKKMKRKKRKGEERAIAGGKHKKFPPITKQQVSSTPKTHLICCTQLIISNP